MRNKFSETVFKNIKKSVKRSFFKTESLKFHKKIRKQVCSVENH